MLNPTSFNQRLADAGRVPSQTSHSRPRRGPSQGRRPKVERVISMSRNASHKSDVGEAPLTTTPNWTKNEKYCVTRLPGRPSQVDNIAQFRILLRVSMFMNSSNLWGYVGRVILCIDFNS